MDDLIKRADAVAAVRSVPPGTTMRGAAIVEAINAIPSHAQASALVVAR